MKFSARFFHRRSKLLSSMALLAIASLSVGVAKADPIPSGWQSEHFKPVGYSDMQGRNAFKLTIKKVGDRWYLFTAKDGLHIIDVTDPTNPKYLKFLPPPANTEMSQVTLHGDLLIVGQARPPTPDDYAGKTYTYNDLQVKAPANKDYDEGVKIYDIKDPTNPKLLSKWEGGALGTHRNIYFGGKYAYLAAMTPGFRSLTLVILDVSDPLHPKQVGQWWYPGQRGDEPQLAQNPGFHGPAYISPDGKMLTLGYSPSLVNLDITDPTHPKLIGELKIIPPFAYNGAQSVHSAVPIWDRNLVVVNSEPMLGNCRGGLDYAMIVDNKDPAKPKPLSIFPTPVPPAGSPYKDFCDKPGRFGPHNQIGEINEPDVEKSSNLIYMTNFNAGLRLFDISDPHLPREVGWFVPPSPTVPKKAQAGVFAVNQTQDVLVDTRGYVYISDSAWGLWILKRD